MLKTKLKISTAAKFIRHSELIKGSGLALIIKLIATVVFYLFTIYLTNTLGASIFGDFVFFISTVKMVSIILVFGSDTMLMRSSAKIKNCEREDLIIDIGNGYVTVISLTVIAFTLLICLYLSGNTHHIFDNFFLLTTLLTAFFLSMLKLHTQLFRGSKKVFYYSFLEFLSVIVLVFILLIISSLLNIEINFHTLVFLYLIATAICSISASYLWQLKGLKKFNTVFTLKKYTFERSVLTNFLKTSSSFLLATSITIFSFWLTQLILRLYHGSVEIGIYEVITKISMLITIPLFAISTIVAPQLAESYNNTKKNTLGNILHDGTSLCILFGVPICFVIFIIPEQFLGLFGGEFLRGKVALQVIVFGYLINILSGPSSLVLQMTKYEKKFRNIALFSALVCIVTGIILIPTLDILGAALAYVSFVLTGSILNVAIVYNKFTLLPLNFSKILGYFSHK